ncbi:MAG TPA: type II secretion system F family protein [Bryobacteraceae bacterium]|jgi:tight adherence protein C|nr:type II secretion system F family protein [Bryobacteraceae bacterium]
MPLIIALSFFIVLLAGITVFGYRYYAQPVRLLERLGTVSGLSHRPASKAAKPRKSLSRFLALLGGMAPASKQEASLLKRELGAAGFRSASAVAIFSGLRIASCVVGLGAGFLCRTLSPIPALHLLIPIGGIAFGYVLPGFGLGRLISRRRDQVRLGLADALDLLVVCCEAGCGLDQAILNVSREFATVHRALSEEFALINMEILAGSSRSAALRNFAARTGEEEVRKLAAILIQTDRFGTSIADALRTQADYMRIRRRQVAEEKAGKVGVKLVFPIFFFCMPALVILVAGPGMIEIMKSFLGPGHGLN